jgi:hypothetical protein
MDIPEPQGALDTKRKQIKQRNTTKTTQKMSNTPPQKRVREE